MKFIKSSLIVATLLNLSSCGQDDTTKSDTPLQMTDQVILGGMAWSDWWLTESGGSGENPQDSLGVTDDGEYKNKYRCKSCHGWDLKGTAGGYSSNLKGDSNKRVVGFQLVGKTVSVEEISKADSRVKLDGTAWADHDAKTMPDYGSSKISHNTLSTDQMSALVSFINDGPKLDDYAIITKGVSGEKNPVYVFNNPDLVKGKSLYESSCERCHGSDGKMVEDLSLGAYFRSAGKYSEGFHKILYGSLGSKMTRKAQGDLDGAQAADILAYIQASDKIFVD